MNNTVIGEIYQSLSLSELKQLDQYLSTSNWQYSETLIRCHECFAENRLKNSIESMSKERVFTHIYIEEQYNDTKLRFVFNRLLEAIKEAIVVKNLRDDNIFSEKIWIDFLIEKKLRKNLQYSIDKPNKAKSVEYKFLFNFFKSEESANYAFRFSKDIKSQFSHMLDLMNNAEYFSDLVFIRNYASLVSFINQYQSIPLELPTQRLQEIKTKNHDKARPEFLVYLKLLNLLDNNNDKECYFEFKNSLFEHLTIWNEDEIDNLLAYMLNFTSQQINRGNIEFIDEQFELFNLFIEKDIYFTRKHITLSRINNAVFIYLRKAEFKKAENFVNKYTEYLSDGTKESCKHFNLARIKFESREYKLSLRELLRVDFSQDTFYSLNSKILLLKNYFELKETDALDSLCTSFSQYVKKNKVISNVYKMNLKNFIKMTSKIYKSSPNKISILMKALENQKDVAEKKWLMEKCIALKK